MHPTPKAIIVSENSAGNKPYAEWIRHLDKKSRAIILCRTRRLEDGNFNDVDSVGEGVYELKIEFGPGFRVYFAQSPTHVYLLGGGQKRHQQRDIDAAKKFWREYA